MNFSDWLKAEVEYGRDLAGSGWRGARDAADSMLQDEAAGELLGRSVRSSWAPTAIGAGVGTVCALIAGGRKPRAAAIAAMGVVGGVVGFTAGVAWETRQLSGGIARGAMHRIRKTRDSHWLDRHPINFG